MFLNLKNLYIENFASSELNRNLLEARARMEQRKLRNEVYGDEWINMLKTLDGDKLAILKLREERKNEYNRKLGTSSKL